MLRIVLKQASKSGRRCTIQERSVLDWHNIHTYMRTWLMLVLMLMLKLMLMSRKQLTLSSSWSLHSKANSGSFVCSWGIPPPFMLHRECKYRQRGRRPKRMVMLSKLESKISPSWLLKFVATLIAQNPPFGSQTKSLPCPFQKQWKVSPNKTHYWWNQKQMFACHKTFGQGTALIFLCRYLPVLLSIEKWGAVAVNT